MIAQTKTPLNDTFGRILPFIGRVQPTNPDTVANVLLALEEAGSVPPVILAARGMDGVHHVAASIGAHAFRLTPAEAALAADCLWCDPSVIGFADIAKRLRDAAAAASRAFLRAGRG